MQEVRNTYHQVKIAPQYFKDILQGLKTFEIRLNDRDYQVNDILELQEWTEEDSYTGNYVIARVYYIFNDEMYLQPNMVLLAIEIKSIQDTSKRKINIDLTK